MVYFVKQRSSKLFPRWEAEINIHHPSRDKFEWMRELAGQKGIDVNDT